MEDHEIVELYWTRSEQAITQTEAKYRRYCRYIAKQILHNDSDAEEIVSDAYLKAWNTIPPNRPKSLKAYVGMLVRQLALNAYEANNAQKRGGQISLMLDELTECIPDALSKTELSEGMALKDALNSFVRKLPEQTQKVFIHRYWYAASVAEIASAYGMKENAVAVLLFRTRKKLKSYLEKEGFTV